MFDLINLWFWPILEPSAGKIKMAQQFQEPLETAVIGTGGAATWEWN